jgi:hypothetical protein
MHQFYQTPAVASVWIDALAVAEEHQASQPAVDFPHRRFTPPSCRFI